MELPVSLIGESVGRGDILLSEECQGTDTVRIYSEVSYEGNRPDFT